MTSGRWKGRIKWKVEGEKWKEGAFCVVQGFNPKSKVPFDRLRAPSPAVGGIEGQNPKL